MEFSLKDQELIVSRYKLSYGMKPGWLKDLSKEIGKNSANISRFAKKLGLTSRNRKKFSKRTLVWKKCIVCQNKFQCMKGKRNKTCGQKCLTEFTSKKWSYYPHPKGMLGKKKNKESCMKQSEYLKEKWADKKSVFNSDHHKQIQSDIMSKRMVLSLSRGNNYSRTKKGWVEFGSKKYYMKSQWEMNYACYLEFLKNHGEIKDWEYECQTFWFEKIKRGIRSYTPDFRVLEKNGNIVFHEVKGWMDDKSKTKIKRMKIYYPETRLIVIDEDQYKSLKKNSALFPGWE